MRRAAPDPGDEPGPGRTAARGGARHGATGTDTPPGRVLDGHGPAAPPTAPLYPAQRRREDTWPPTPADATPAVDARAARRGPPLDEVDPGVGAPAPRAGSGPLPPTAPPAPGAPVDGHAAGDALAAAPTAAVPLVPAVEPARPAAPGAADEPEDGLPDDIADAIPDDDTAEGWALVRAAQDGDTQAFGQLFDRYHDTVFRFVLFRLGDRPAAEDLTQETFVRAYRRIASVSYQGRDIGAWFVTIARNLVLDHVKSSRYRLESSHAEVADVAPATLRPGPENEVIAGATHAELLRCVAKLGEDQQECIALRFLQGLSVAETAEIMGRNEGAVKALQHRAVRRLAQLLPEGLR
ncbi:RNA polymerase sigma-70 factor (TIGR02952 family) [Actinomycetospora cinnamomea]|uniref:RNA polymerase sigma factor n=1 Tax=Actinomycetospora cinnamomea TaxID=663609 RepID=A0A2U1FD05_9PSEU|nr:RNA polymerase sigma-70 factor (TIGR02952 family) [Actinomycetospora cinnamomea]